MRSSGNSAGEPREQRLRRRDSGGGIFNSGGRLTLRGTTVADNAADRLGGGIYSALGDTALTDSAVSGNSADLGGGIFLSQGTTA